MYKGINQLLELVDLMILLLLQLLHGRLFCHELIQEFLAVLLSFQEEFLALLDLTRQDGVLL